jgi:predicted MFS family arabinose efflux permease
MTKILLVDDSKFLRLATGRALERAGYEVSTATDGPNALEMAREQKPDLILLDMLLPKMTGTETRTERGNWRDVLKSRNIRVAMVALFCAMTGVFVLGAMLPLYLTDYLALDTQRMGVVVSAIGFGGFIGQFGLPGLSDLVGRRMAGIVGFAGAAVMLYLFRGLGAQPLELFAVLFVASFFTLGLVSLLSGPVATEAAPAGMTSTSIGVVVGAGEIFGGGVAPALAGFVATHFGIQNILWLPICAVVLGIGVCLLLEETAPAPLRRRVRAGIELPASEQPE